ETEETACEARAAGERELPDLFVLIDEEQPASTARSTEVAEHISAGELRHTRAPVHESADHRDAFVVVVLCDRVDQIRRIAARGRLICDESAFLPVRVEVESALFDVPTEVAARDDSVHLLDIVLTGIRRPQLVSVRVDRYPERI